MKRCNLVVGLSGSGKTTYVRNLCETHGYEFYSVTDLSVDSIKDLTTHNIISERVYCIENIEGMSVQSQNTLLKVIEEGHSKMYFYLTTNNLVVLPTIISRSNIIRIKPPTLTELRKYVSERLEQHSSLNSTLFMDNCKTFGDVEQLLTYGLDGTLVQLVSLVDLVYRNITAVSISNALVAADRVKAIENDTTVYIWFLKLLSSKVTTYKIKHLCNTHIQVLINNTLDRNRLMSKFFTELRIQVDWG